MENPIKMDDLGIPLFLETPIYIYIYCSARHQPAGTRDGTQLMHSEETLKKKHGRKSTYRCPRNLGTG